MSAPSSVRVWLVIPLVAVVATLGVVMGLREGGGSAERSPAASEQPADGITTPPAATAATALPVIASGEQPAPAPGKPDPVGVAPSVPADLNPNVRSVMEAARTGTHPERLSPLIAPKPFDPAAFAADPKSYMDIVEPGRVFQSAEPGPDVPVLNPQGSASFEIAVGESCTLTVTTRPGYPVTFIAPDLGTFPNSLTSITVQADAQGVASTVYRATGGVIADAQVLAGSPGASGQVKFHLFVTRPVAAAK